MREWIEYAGGWTGLKILGLLPRGAARFVGANFAAVAYALRTAAAAGGDVQSAARVSRIGRDAQRKQVIRG